MGSEDVGLFTLDGKIPGVMFWLGAADPGSSHTRRRRAFLCPAPFAAVRAGVRADNHHRRHGYDGDGAQPLKMILRYGARHELDPAESHDCCSGSLIAPLSRD